MRLECEARDVLKYERLRLERLQEVEVVIDASGSRIEPIAFLREPETSMGERSARWSPDQIPDVISIQTSTVKKIVRLKILYLTTDGPRAETGAKDPQRVFVMVGCYGDA